MKIVFVDHYDSFSYNLISWLKRSQIVSSVEHFYFDSKGLDSVKIKFENNDFLEEKVIKLRSKQIDSSRIKSNIKRTCT